MLHVLLDKAPHGTDRWVYVVDHVQGRYQEFWGKKANVEGSGRPDNSLRVYRFCRFLNLQEVFNSNETCPPFVPFLLRQAVQLY